MTLPLAFAPVRRLPKIDGKRRKTRTIETQNR